MPRSDHPTNWFCRIYETNHYLDVSFVRQYNVKHWKWIPSTGLTSDDFEGFCLIFFQPFDNSFLFFQQSLSSGGRKQDAKFFKDKSYAMQPRRRCLRLWGHFGHPSSFCQVFGLTYLYYQKIMLENLLVIWFFFSKNQNKIEGIWQKIFHYIYKKTGEE